MEKKEGKRGNKEGWKEVKKEGKKEAKLAGNDINALCLKMPCQRTVIML